MRALHVQQKDGPIPLSTASRRPRITQRGYGAAVSSAIAAVPDDVKLSEFVETYWRLHGVPNLRPATRSLYGHVWSLHILPRLGDYSVRELTPKRLTRFRAELERAGVGTATIVKAMTIVRSID